MTAWLGTVWRRSCRRSLPNSASAHAVRQHFVRIQIPPTFGIARKIRLGVARPEQRLDERPRGLATRRRARARLRINEIDGILADVAPAQVEHFTAAASGERQQPDRGDGLGPARLVRVECTPEPSQLVGVKEAGDLLPRTLAMPRQGLVSRSRNLHSSARNIIARMISSARLAAPGLSLLAASNHAAMSCAPIRSSGILPNAGRVRALR